MKARNYGRQYSGGDAYAMGEALNEELRMAYENYKQDRAWMRQHPDRLSAVLLHADSVNYMRALCRIRRAARGDALRTSIGVNQS